MDKYLKSPKVVILVLVVLAAAFVLFKGSQKMSAGKSDLTENKTVNQPGDISASVSSQPETFPSYFTKEEIAALTLPGAKATLEEQSKYLGEVKKLAQTATSVELDENCFGKPLVLTVKKDAKVMFKNMSSNDRTVLLTPEKDYTIPAKGSKEVTVATDKDAGVLVYHCSGLSLSGGVFYLTK